MRVVSLNKRDGQGLVQLIVLKCQGLIALKISKVEENIFRMRQEGVEYVSGCSNIRECVGNSG